MSKIPTREHPLVLVRHLWVYVHTHTHKLQVCADICVCVCVCCTYVDLFWSNIERVSPRQVDLSSALIFNITNCWLKHLEFSMADSSNNNLFILLLFVHVLSPLPHMFMSQFTSYIELWFYLFIENCIANNLVAFFMAHEKKTPRLSNFCLWKLEMPNITGNIVIYRKKYIIRNGMRQKSLSCHRSYRFFFLLICTGHSNYRNGVMRGMHEYESTKIK